MSRVGGPRVACGQRGHTTMANRRKFLAGLGALASGTAAAVGTGAFTSVRAERNVNVTVAGDNEAYLALDAAISDYAEETGDTLELQFDGSNSGQNGQGLNANADTFFQNVFRIENQGTSTIRLQLANDDFSGEGTSIGQFPEGPMVVSYTDEELTGANSQSTPFAASTAPSYWSNSGAVTDQDIGPGDDLYVHIGFFMNDDTAELPASASTDPADIPDDIGFYAGDTAGPSDF